MKDLTGRVFGNLLVVKFIGAELTRTEKPRRWGYFWKCRCLCGGEIKVQQSQLTGRKILCCSNCYVPIRVKKKSMENMDRGTYKGFFTYFTENGVLFKLVFGKEPTENNIKKEWEVLNV